MKKYTIIKKNGPMAYTDTFFCYKKYDGTLLSVTRTPREIAKLRRQVKRGFWPRENQNLVIKSLA